MIVRVNLFCLAIIGAALKGSSAGSYGSGVKGGCPTMSAFFNLAPISPCYGTRCTRAQCQADCDRTSACAGYEFDAREQGINQPGYCFMLSKTCPLPLNKVGEDYVTRTTYMKTRLTFKDDVPITFSTINENRIYKTDGWTGPVQTASIYKPQRFQWQQNPWQNRRKPIHSLRSARGPLFEAHFNKLPTTPATVQDLPDFVSIPGGCPSSNSFLHMAQNFICHGRRCPKVDCASACLSSSVCIGFEFDGWDQSSISSHGYCWLLRSTCKEKLTSEGEDFASRWTYLRRWDERSTGGDDAESVVIKIGAAPPQMPVIEHSNGVHPVEQNFLTVKAAGEGIFSKVDKEKKQQKQAMDITVSNQPLVPKMQFVHGWNLQQPYMMSVGGCTSSPGGGSLVYLPMEVSSSRRRNVTTTTEQPMTPSMRQCMYHQCSRFDCENTCNQRPECVGYEFAATSHGLTTVGYCHLLKRPCPPDQRSEGTVFLTRLTYLKAE